jgi:hypothetical protein
LTAGLGIGRSGPNPGGELGVGRLLAVVGLLDVALEGEPKGTEAFVDADHVVAFLFPVMGLFPR